METFHLLAAGFASAQPAVVRPAVLASALVAACGCGAGDAPLADTSPPAHLRVAAPDGTLVELGAPARRIVPTNSSAVDFLAVLVGPERLAALPAQAFTYSLLDPRFSDWDRSRTFHTYRAEDVLALGPDLVVSHAWQSPDTTALLREAGVAVVAIPTVHTFDDVLETVGFLGALLEVPERAAAFRADLLRRRDALAAAERPSLRVLSYTNIGVGGWTAGEGTTAHLVIELAGLTNAAAEGGGRSHYRLDVERLLELDPDVIVVGVGDEVMSPAARYLREEPAFRHLRALREDRVVELPVELFSTNSHHLVTAAERLAAAVDGSD
ncbi:MAG: ABC transporter substrate-binding protein [Planctomycetota bacterium]|jgi:iron complex transport system substrate-binding protein|nr:ABC transporter substrate-binding protein [Planctomycetota bacterium]MDP6762833.1 ABC transporter substrate-binding protein [Planctomycetota bacterium]MDP6988489.1 ABC transporter substrate-binding protein [Planctomycetota bacterium]